MYVRLLKLFFYIILSWIFLNITAEFLIFIKKKIIPTNIITQRYGKNIVKKVYPNLKETEINELLNHTWGRKNEFDAFSGFIEKPYQSQFVNIDKNGFRITTNEKLPIDTTHYNIFMFGGSHLFGYGVKDDETIAYYLQKKISEKIYTKKVKVYNFGCAFYYSDQERSRFVHLLAQNEIPNQVIFLSGLNEFYFEKPYHSEKLKNLMAENINTIGEIWWNQFPLMRKKIIENNENENKMSIQKIIQRFENNLHIVQNLCENYKIEPIFVLQPIPFYEYDLKYHLFAPKNEIFIKKGYEKIRKIKNISNFLDLSTLQKNQQKNFYVDKVHYTPEMNEIIASNILKYLFRKKN